MDHSELLKQIKKQLIEEFEYFRADLENRIPAEQRKQLKEAKDTSTAFIKENPWASAGIAVFLGFALARFFYKQEDDK